MMAGVDTREEPGLDSLLEHLEHTVSHQRREETVTRVTKHYSTSLHTRTREQDSYSTDTSEQGHSRQADITTHYNEEQWR